MATEEEGGAGVEGEEAVPVGGGGLFERGGQGDTGVVDEDVESAYVAADGLGELLDGGGVGQVGRQDQR